MKKILVIDDISVNIEAIKNILQFYLPDYEMISAQSGQEGIELARTHRPETILLDYLMPNMNGFEVCQTLKGDERTKRIPVLMVSALGDNSNVRTEGLNAGADAFISKPFDIREFVALVNVMLRIKSAEDLLRKRNEELEIIIKKQSRQYQDSEERFLQISRHAQEFFWEIDQDFKFTFVSQSAESILGYDTKVLLNRYHLFDLASDHKVPGVRDKIKSHLQQRFSFTDNEYPFSTKNGRIVWLAINGFPVTGEDDVFKGYRGVCDDNTRRKEAEDSLKKSMVEINNYQRKLKKLNRELTMAEEIERKRIAEYIHDGIGQMLSLAFINLSEVLTHNLPEYIQKNIENTAGLLNDAIARSRLLTYDLSPPVLYEFGLLTAIKWKLDKTAKELNIETRFLNNDLHPEFNAETSISLYRIICELITNVIKHAEASKLTIEINKSKLGYNISVIDNGKGFDVKSIEMPGEIKSFGLFSINERLDSMNGSLTIESKIGKGTRATIFIPVNLK